MRIGVVGNMGLDFFAENIRDALQRMGHHVVPLGSAQAHYKRRLASRAALIARQALPGLDEGIQRRIVHAALEAECEVVSTWMLTLCRMRSPASSAAASA